MGPQALALGADDPPQGFVFPDANTYLQGLAQATAAMAPTVTAKSGSVLDTVPPPVKVQISGLGMVLEGATGMSLGDLSQVAMSVVDLAAATNAVQVASALTELLDASLSVATTIAEAAGAAADVLNTVPLLGQMVSAMGGFILDVLKSQALYAQAQKNCQDRVGGEVDAMCSKLVSQARSLGTSASGVSPADMFRPVAYRWQSNSHMPLSPSSIYVALCADQVQQWPRVSIDFVKLIEAAQWHQRNKIPKEVKRQMWRLCKGLMKSVRPPVVGFQGQWFPQDHGRSLFPILQSIVITQKDLGNIDDALMSDMGKLIAGTYRISKDCPDLVPGGGGAGAMPHGAGSCSDRVNLFEPFYGGLLEYQAKLEEEYLVNGQWQTKPKTLVMGKPGGGVLALSPQATSNLLKNEQSILDSILKESHYPAFGQLKIWQKALLAAGTAGAGYLGFEAVRRWT